MRMCGPPGEHPADELAVSVVTVEEMFRGRLAVPSRRRLARRACTPNESSSRPSPASTRWPWCRSTSPASSGFRRFALASFNHRDFTRVTRMRIEDWFVP